jgi:perosamine synthetase
MKQIPLFRPSYDKRELNALKEPFENGWLGLGPKTKEFEDKFAAYVGSKYANGLNSATSALHLALSLFNIKGKEVITTPFTFVSTNHAILYEGGIPVFCDIEPDTLNIDPTKIEALITKNTVGIICVDYGGHPCDMDAINKIAKKHKLFVLEDAAHSCGSKYKGKMVGSLTDITSFSFHAVKNLATGDGGMLTYDKATWDTILRKRRWLGISKSTFDRNITKKGYHWYYEVEELGFKYHMNDINAALGIVQLEKLNKHIEKKRAIAKKYTEALKGLEWLSTPVEKPYAWSSTHNYAIQMDESIRDIFVEYMLAKGISVGMHYIPNHLYKMYKPYYRKLPIAESAWKKVVLLPMFPQLTKEEITYIIATVQAFKPEASKKKKK